ncbi:flagellar basal body L-ring protein FlgH [Seohaeicola saemankumensis]|uniref:flagellar basal body L-ring protein FlgH n=1 Tax=Seohaeicola saemankumensis TaxID=481181 RepID=UPI001E589E7C|nr:flagellar basal body L-ring protein FlgH [Seohaeicola saemankumensis]MCD1625039.1 flagellar basal body L-ring protein FlgH [Seohaeicola saemankumensis]
MFRLISVCCCVAILAAACGREAHMGRVPPFTPSISSIEHSAMLSPGLPLLTVVEAPVSRASLWTGGRQSLLGDRRAMQRGDILTVVVEIDEKAEISNTSARSRSGSESLGIPQLFGIPQRLNERLPDGATMAGAVSIDSDSDSRGTGSVRRNEKLTLRIAATILDVLPNGVLSIQGSQEVRVNFEMRELFVTGFVRPADISRQNEITYDKIASARVSYGGRGQISDMQQPRYGQQLLDALLPF